MKASIRRVDQSGACAFAVSAQNRVIAWNGVAEKTLGWTAREAIGLDISKVIEAKDLFGNRCCASFCGLHEMARREEPIHALWMLLKKKDGGYGEFFGSVQTVRSKDDGHDAGSQSDENDLVFELHEERRRKTAGALIERLLHRQIGYAPVAKAKPAGATPQLTARQKEVLSLLAEGMEPHRIAKKLGVSVNTVRNHIQRILFTLKCHSQANAVAIAIRQGLI
jgi:DNA-binding CsgD family transcriptional regulator